MAINGLFHGGLILELMPLSVDKAGQRHQHHRILNHSEVIISLLAQLRSANLLPGQFVSS